MRLKYAMSLSNSKYPHTQGLLTEREKGERERRERQRERERKREKCVYMNLQNENNF